MRNLVSPEVIRSRLSRIGKSYSDVARELGVDRSIVSRVVDGRLKGDRGDAHKVAVALGLKDGVIVADDLPLAEAMKVAAAA